MSNTDQFTLVNRDRNLNSLQTIQHNKVPRYRSLAQVGGISGEPGYKGNIILNRQDQTFYGHNGIEWIPLRGGGGGGEPATHIVMVQQSRAILPFGGDGLFMATWQPFNGTNFSEWSFVYTFPFEVSGVAVQCQKSTNSLGEVYSNFRAVAFDPTTTTPAWPNGPMPSQPLSGLTQFTGTGNSVNIGADDLGFAFAYLDFTTPLPPNTPFSIGLSMDPSGQINSERCQFFIRYT